MKNVIVLLIGLLLPTNISAQEFTWEELQAGAGILSNIEFGLPGVFAEFDTKDPDKFILVVQRDCSFEYVADLNYKNPPHEKTISGSLFSRDISRVEIIRSGGIKRPGVKIIAPDGLNLFHVKTRIGHNGTVVFETYHDSVVVYTNNDADSRTLQHVLTMIIDDYCS